MIAAMVGKDQNVSGLRTSAMLSLFEQILWHTDLSISRLVQLVQRV